MGRRPCAVGAVAQDDDGGTRGAPARRRGPMSRKQIAMIRHTSSRCCLLLDHSRGYAAFAGVVLAAALSCAAVGDDGPAVDRAHTPLSEIAAVSLEPPTSQPTMSEEQAAKLEEAERLFEDDQWIQALQILDELRDDPASDTYDVNLQYAMCCLRLEFDDEALDAAKRAARRRPTNADANVLIGSLLVKRGRSEQAIGWFRLATLAGDTEINNANVTWAWYQLGRLLAEAGYLKAAEQAWGRFDERLWSTHTEHRNASHISELLADNPRGAFDSRIDLLRELKDWDGQLELTRSALRRFPDDSVIRRAHVRALLDAGQSAEAFAFARAQLRRPNGRADFLESAVTAAIAAGRLDAWVAELVARLGDDGEEALTLANAVTDALARHEQYAAAARLGRAVLDVAPDRTDVALRVAEVLAAQGDGTEALALLERQVCEHGDKTVWSSRQLQRAVAVASRVGDLDRWVAEHESEKPHDFARDFVLGVAAMAAGRLEDAGAAFARAFEAHPDCTPAQIARAEIMLSRYQWEAARAYADDLLKQHPKLAVAYYVLGRAYDGLDDDKQAEKALKRAVHYDPAEPAYALALARFYHRIGVPVSAQRYYRQALSHDPANDEAFEGLIDSYLSGGQPELARDEYQRLKDRGVSADARRRVETSLRFLAAPFAAAHMAELARQVQAHADDVETRKVYATGLFLTRQYESALEQIREALKQAPDDYDLAMDAAVMFRRRAHFDEAVQVLQRLRAHYPNRRRVLETLAIDLIYDFQVEPGRALLEDLVKTDDAGRYRRSLIVSYQAFGEFDTALERLDRWLADDPQDPELIALKIGVLLAADRLDDAFAAAQEWLADDPSDSVRLDTVVRVGEAAKAYDELVALLRKRIEDGGDAFQLTDTLIRVLLAAGKADEALKLAQQFEGTFADQVIRRVWMGRCRAVAGDLELTRKEFESLLSERTVSDEVKPLIRREYISALLDAKAYDEALQFCDGWIRSGAESGDGMLRLKLRVLLAAERPESEQAEVMAVLVKHNPNDVGLANDLGYTWADAGQRLDEAEQMIRTAVGDEPLNAAFLDSLGWVLYKRGAFEQARMWLERAVQMRGGQDGTISDHLADAAYRLGDIEAARKHWQAAVAAIESDDAPRSKRGQALLEQIRHKLEALDQHVEPAVAPVVGTTGEG